MEAVSKITLYKIGRYADSNLMRGVFTNNYLNYNIAVRYRDNNK